MPRIFREDATRRPLANGEGPQLAPFFPAAAVFRQPCQTARKKQGDSAPIAPANDTLSTPSFIDGFDLTKCGYATYEKQASAAAQKVRALIPVIGAATGIAKDDLASGKRPFTVAQMNAIANVFGLPDVPAE